MIKKLSLIFLSATIILFAAITFFYANDLFGAFLFLVVGTVMILLTLLSERFSQRMAKKFNDEWGEKRISKMKRKALSAKKKRRS